MSDRIILGLVYLFALSLVILALIGMAKPQPGKQNKGIAPQLVSKEDMLAGWGLEEER